MLQAWPRCHLDLSATCAGVHHSASHHGGEVDRGLADKQLCRGIRIVCKGLCNEQYGGRNKRDVKAFGMPLA